MAKTTPKLYVVSEAATSMQTINGWRKMSNGHIEFDACLQTADDMNRNHNEYPKDVLGEAINHPRIKELVSRHAWFGEIAHPWDRKNLSRSIDILPAEISHRICTMPHWKGTSLIATIHTVEPRGSIIDSWVVDEGAQLGFSMRGLTPYFYMKDTPIAHKVMKSPMTVLTYDTVFYPSHKDALYNVTPGLTKENADLLKSALKRDPSLMYESSNILEEVKDYISEESAIFKIFKEELGIDLATMENTMSITHHDGEDFLMAELTDGRLAEVNVEANILSEIRQAIL